MKWILLIYFAVISVFAFLLTGYDKHSARKGRRRISEKTLMSVSLCGGALVMYITMLTVRHKTKHIKFMLCLPLMAVLHIIILYSVYKYI